MKVSIRRLTHGEGLPTPSYASDGAAGLDLLVLQDRIIGPEQLRGPS